MIIEVFEKDIRQLIEKLSDKRHDTTKRTRICEHSVSVRLNKRNVLFHRNAIEETIGRKLLHSEHVHHINGNPFDNRLENLMIVSPKQHMQIHGAAIKKRNRDARRQNETEQRAIRVEGRAIRKNYIKGKDAK
jgi:hypothetical protein